MKKTILFKALALIVAMTASVSLVSCGDDDKNDDDIPVDPAAFKAVSVNYSVDASDDFFEFYDIRAEYGLAPGPGTSEEFLIPGWSFSGAYERATVAFPITVFCKVVAVPKAATPTIDPEKVYNFRADYSMAVNGLRNDNQTTVLVYRSSSHPSVTMKGEKVSTYLDRGEIVVTDFSYTVE